MIINDSHFQVFSSHEEYNPIFDILQYKFPQLLTEMLKDEFYILQDKTYDYFSTINVDGEVVGFFSGDYLTDNVFMLDLIFMCGAYRGKGLLKEVLDRIYTGLNVRLLVINNPNHFLICSLIKYGYATIDDKCDDLGVMGDGLCLSFEDKKNDKIRFSKYYDLFFSAVVVFNGFVCLSPLQSVDDEFFDARKRRSIVNYI